MCVLDEVKSSQGMASTFNAWEEHVSNNDLDRVDFYLKVISEHLAIIAQRSDVDVKDVPVVLSGMASSTIGILNMPYKQLPFNTDGRDLETRWIQRSKEFAHDVLLISGICNDDDVIRGEETQLIGCIEGNAKNGEEQLYILPGTHSKHIYVENGSVNHFQTFMTGEFFALLSTKSILSSSVAVDSMFDAESFKKGVSAGANTNLLHAAFLTRTNELFGKNNKAQNYSYLSGIIIGTELKDLQGLKKNIYLCCSGNLKKQYEAALDALGLNERLISYPSEWIDGSVIRGQLKLLKAKQETHE